MRRLIFVFLAAIAGLSTLLVPLTSPTVCSAKVISPDGWEWQNPLPQGNPLRGVWGSSSSDVFAVGDYGTILHYDGSSWSGMTSGTTYNLHGVWGTSPSDVFAVDTEGTILHYDGSSWNPMSSGTKDVLYAVWGSSPSDAFAVGWGGTIVHYDGNSWSPMTSSTTNHLLGVWGTSPSDAFAVGTDGTILHYDGSSWSPMSSGTTSYLFDVWGSSPSDAFAVGTDGTILHYDGSSWSPMSSGTLNHLFGVWGTSPSDVFAVDIEGTILHYDGSSWNPMSSGTKDVLFDVWGSSPSDAFAVGWGGTIVHYDGNSWSPMSSGTGYGLRGVWGTCSTDVFTVGDEGAILHYDGSSWSPMSSGTTSYLFDVWGSSPSDAFAVGTDGTILHYDGSSWSPMSSGTTDWLDGIWGSSPSNVFAVGDEGAILHYDGSSWSPMSSGTTSYLYAVWGSSPSDVFTVGDEGAILHYDGSAWSPMSSGTTDWLDGIWGSSPSNVFAVGGGDTIVHYDGSSWSPMSSGTTSYLYAVWGSSPSDAFAVGWGGTIVHYDGNSWSPMTSSTGYGLRGVWGTCSTDVFAVGDEGTILHYGIGPVPTPPETYAPTLKFDNDENYYPTGPHEDDHDVTNNRENYEDGKFPGKPLSYYHIREYEDFFVYEYWYYYAYTDYPSSIWKGFGPAFIDAFDHEHGFGAAFVWVDTTGRITGQVGKPFYYALRYYSPFVSHWEREVSNTSELVAYVEVGVHGMGYSAWQVLGDGDGRVMEGNEFEFRPMSELEELANDYDDLTKDGNYKTNDLGWRSVTVPPGLLPGPSFCIMRVPQVKAPWLCSDFEDPDWEIRLTEAGIPTSLESLKDIKRLQVLIIASPVELRVRDSEDRVTGIVNGQVKTQIPYSSYYDDNVVLLFSADTYRYQVVDVGEGSYDLSIGQHTEEQTTNFTATDIPVTSKAVHEYTIDWDALAQGEEGVTLQMDAEGDGVFEQTITSGPTLQWPPPPVGGTIIPTDKLGLVIPWIVAAALIVVAGVSLAIWNKKRETERPSG